MNFLKFKLMFSSNFYFDLYQSVKMFFHSVLLSIISFYRFIVRCYISVFRLFIRFNYRIFSILSSWRSLSCFLFRFFTWLDDILFGHEFHDYCNGFPEERKRMIAKDKKYGRPHAIRVSKGYVYAYYPNMETIDQFVVYKGEVVAVIPNSICKYLRKSNPYYLHCPKEKTYLAPTSSFDLATFICSMLCYSLSYQRVDKLFDLILDDPYISNESFDFVNKDPFSFFSCFPYYYPIISLNPWVMLYLCYSTFTEPVFFDPIYGCYLPDYKFEVSNSYYASDSSEEELWDVSYFGVPPPSQEDQLDPDLYNYRLHIIHMNSLYDSYERFNVGYFFGTLCPSEDESPYSFVDLYRASMGSTLNLDDFFEFGDLYLLLMYLRRVRRYIIDPADYSLYSISPGFYKHYHELFTFMLARFICQGDYLNLYYKPEHKHSHKPFYMNFPYKKLFHFTTVNIVAFVSSLTGFSVILAESSVYNLGWCLFALFISFILSIFIYILQGHQQMVSWMSFILNIVGFFFYAVFLFPLFSNLFGLFIFTAYCFYCYFYVPYSMYFSFSSNYSYSYYESRYSSMYKSHDQRLSDFHRELRSPSSDPKVRKLHLDYMYDKYEVRKVLD